MQVARRYDARLVPVIAGADVHVLDESHHDGGAAESVYQLKHGVVVDAALHDAVDFDRREAGGERGVDSLEDLPWRAVAAGHRPEDRWVERVEAHGHAAESLGL